MDSGNAEPNDDHHLTLPGGATVEHLSVNTSKEALGIQIRPDGGMEDEVEYLNNKVLTWCTMLRTQKSTAMRHGTVLCVDHHEIH